MPDNSVLVSMPRASSSVTVEAEAGSVPHSATSFRADASERQQSNLRAFPVSAQSSARTTPSHLELTDREMEVLELAHLDNADTGAALGISWATAKAHWRRINLKLGAENRAHAIEIWLTRQNRRAA